MPQAALVIDANILVRAVLGKKVRQIILNHHQEVKFITPDICIAEAKKYLPLIFDKRNLPPHPASEVLYHIESLLQIIDKSIYQEYAEIAKKRIAPRDKDDWPIVATALAFNHCPIWTEDQDFFGSGLAIWTTDRIHLFFES